jgi:hypothetical protein
MNLAVAKQIGINSDLRPLRGIAPGRQLALLTPTLLEKNNERMLPIHAMNVKL